jgi:predicted enzyme related to lactoylglutathione lyase
MACIFFLIADYEDDNKGVITWLNLLGEDDVRSAIDVYVASMSWSFTTVATVGYGDIYAVTEAEKIFATIAMIISCGVFAYIVGFLGSVFDKNS